MAVILEIVLFVCSFAVSLFYLSNLVLPIFYGIPKSTIGYFRGRLRPKVIFLWLIAPMGWTVGLIVFFFFFDLLWPTGFRRVAESTGFNLGQVAATVVFLLGLLGKKTRADARQEFEEFVAPYRRAADGIQKE